ncbi:MAG TPA: hypothetical protein VEM59_06475 [Acidimicrobiia bacterium]|jgi:hypothetical protein|nr:hypothetical protein [Acidimicrobiia bacterium]
MNTWVWIVIAAAIVVLAAIVFLRVRTQQRRRELRDWFGPAYDRSFPPERSRRRAESEPAKRAERRQALPIRPLTQAGRARYSAQWNQLQNRFADRPEVVVVEADDLITQAMRDRGYPVDDFESKSELVSVDHPDVVRNYRDAHTVYTKTTTGEASTDDLRRAVIAYRALFEELVTHDAGRGDRAGP